MALPGADSVEFDGYRVGDFLGEGTVPGGVFVNAIPQRRGMSPKAIFPEHQQGGTRSMSLIRTQRNCGVQSRQTPSTFTDCL